MKLRKRKKRSEGPGVRGAKGSRSEVIKIGIGIEIGIEIGIQKQLSGGILSRWREDRHAAGK